MGAVPWPIEQRALLAFAGDMDAAARDLDAGDTVPFDRICPTCIHELDESNFCSVCGKVLKA